MSQSVSPVIRYDCTEGFVDGVILPHRPIGPYGASCVFISGENKLKLVKVLHQFQLDVAE